MMKISVIIPYHKGEAYLKDCLDSLKEQTAVDIEILLICDHVLQEELQCLTLYEAELTIKVHHMTNKTGVAAARNLGLDLATGDYVYFLDSDDYLIGNTIENLLQAALDRNDDIVYGKNKSTWLGRSVYLARKHEQEVGAFEEQNEVTDENPQHKSGAENDDENNDSEDSEEEDKNSNNESVDRAEDQNRAENETDEMDEGSDETLMDDEEEQINDLTQDHMESLSLSQEELELLELRRIEARANQAYRILVNKRKGIRNISVLNILFKRSFLEEHKIRFLENLKYMSDVPFLLETLSKTKRFKKRLSANYMKRKHNDPINFPSLSQVKDPNRFNEFIDTYYETMKRIPDAIVLKDMIDKKYISYYTRVYAPKLKRSKNSIWREDNFIRMSDIIHNVRPEVLHTLKGYKKRMIYALIKKDINKSVRMVIIHLAVKKLKSIVKSKKAFTRFLYTHFFLKQPLKEECILFESFFGKSYSGSPKYIYQYISQEYPSKYKCVWVIDKKSTQIPYKHKKIKRNGILYSYYLARSKYFVFNGRQPEWVVKREGNKFLQTWHGTPLKKLVFDIEDISSASPKYKQQVYKQSRAWDYLVAPNAFSSETFRRCFMFENKMLETGYPRNDILHDPNGKEIATKLRKKLGIPMDKKTILYAPTWRDDDYYAKGQYKFKLHMDLKKMREELGNEYVILLRTHYFIADSLDVSGVEDFAYNLSKYDDISELYLISDLLITDYSSVFFDYANLKRPILFYTYDLEKYRDVLRGFYFDIEKEVPGPLLYTTEDIIESVKNIDQVSSEYSQRYNEFYHRFCEWEDGHAAEKVVKSVFE